MWTHAKLEELRASAPDLLAPAGAMTSQEVKGALLRLQERWTQLHLELSGRRAGPHVNVPAGAVCAVNGEGCGNPLEVGLGCGNGHFMCRPCYWGLCKHARQGGQRCARCPLCRAPFALPAA
jgi:hypothetical protein